ncbi:hypothetical protein HUT16_04215 [Kitasatospora sp. NA04385]|uniref:hypothetical protein n=1 Tax=Kitasatospora sp. NA04385 TaxID=2742135 RepID=UPI001590311F|nr:hypothetical protein [Kitasatospora sp. NA04385]QKW18374.1 hypothetical protein HUT16_04215 [Kitasatospora sp. NA04385]
MDFPCLLLDDDGQLMSCADDAELQQLTEPDFTDEITAAYDSAARPLELHLIGTRRPVIALRPAGEPRPEELAAHVRAYFHHWTDRDVPPDVLHDVALIAAAVDGTPVCRRRRR